MIQTTRRMETFTGLKDIIWLTWSLEWLRYKYKSQKESYELTYSKDNDTETHAIDEKNMLHFR